MTPEFILSIYVGGVVVFIVALAAYAGYYGERAFNRLMDETPAAALAIWPISIPLMVIFYLFKFLAGRK